MKNIIKNGGRIFILYLDNNKDVPRAKDARVDAVPGSPFWIMPYESSALGVDSREMHAMLQN